MPQLDPSCPTIAVIDDDPDIVELVLALLGLAGHAGVACQPDAGAQARLRVMQPALILLDIRMPEIDGITLALQLRQDSATRATPIVFMTATPEWVPDRIPAYRDLGMSILAKPFELRQLNTVIDRALAAR